MGEKKNPSASKVRISGCKCTPVNITASLRILLSLPFKKLKSLKINDKSLVKKHNSSTFMTWSLMLCQDVSPQRPQRVTITTLTTQSFTSPVRLPTHMLIAANDDNAFCVVKWTPGMGLFSSFHRGQQLSNDCDFWPEKKI